jgi:hypothetical protein
LGFNFTSPIGGIIIEAVGYLLDLLHQLMIEVDPLLIAAQKRLEER